VFGIYPLNAYGPLFNLLAGLAWGNSLAPKLMFAWAYVLFSVWQVKSVTTNGRMTGLATAGLLCWFWNPFAWIEIAYFGHFDILVGLACVAAVRARSRDRDFLSGTCLAAGVLLKYIPIVILPFLAIEGERVRRRLLVTALVTIALGLGASIASWGLSTFRPLTFAAVRPSARLSVLKFLEGRYSPLYSSMTANRSAELEALAMLVLALALAQEWTWCRRRVIDPAAAAVLAVLMTFLLYRVGFPQYQMVLFVLLSDWGLRKLGHLNGQWLLILASVSVFSWFAFFDVLDCIIEIKNGWIEDAVGLPSFLLGSFLAVCVIRSAEPFRKVPITPCAGVASLD
jgi:hypothetical protein